MKILYLLYVYLILSILCIAGCSSGSSGAVNIDLNTDTESKSGSTAKMLVHEDAIYLIDGKELKVFDVSSPEDVRLANALWVSSFETAYIYGQHLYLGGQLGVSVYDISEPLEPIEAGFYNHDWACDPIVVDQGIGYVTLRNRGGCAGDANRLEIVDFSNPSAPIEISRFNMDKPFGLSFIGRYLAVCEEEFGLTVLDVALSKNAEGYSAEVEKLTEYDELYCFDLIYQNQILIATASDGIYQYAVDDGYYLTELSKIPVGRSEAEGDVE